MNWQPIETAPKDGTSFLAWDNGFTEATWSAFANGWMHPFAGWGISPTHWMPLPSGPAP